MQQYLHTLFLVHKWNSLCLEIVPNAKASPYMIYGLMLENTTSYRGIEETRGYLQCVMGRGEEAVYVQMRRIFLWAIGGPCTYIDIYIYIFSLCSHSTSLFAHIEDDL